MPHRLPLPCAAPQYVTQSLLYLLLDLLWREFITNKFLVIESTKSWLSLKVDFQLLKVSIYYYCVFKYRIGKIEIKIMKYS